MKEGTPSGRLAFVKTRLQLLAMSVVAQIVLATTGSAQTPIPTPTPVPLPVANVCQTPHYETTHIVPYDVDGDPRLCSSHVFVGTSQERPFELNGDRLT